MNYKEQCLALEEALACSNQEALDLEQTVALFEEFIKVNDLWDNFEDYIESGACDAD